MRFLITGGGTGGHIYPALTIAKALKAARPEAEILYVGSREGLEADLVPREGIPFEAITVAGIMRKSPPEAVRGLLRAGQGTIESYRILRRFRPDVAVGTGGYVCGPVVFSAWVLRIPTAIQEQNVIPGVTNRVLSRLADRVFLPFEEARRWVAAGGKVKVTGNPLRPEILTRTREEGAANLGIDPRRKLIYAFGGSRGARSINDALPDLARVIAERPDACLIWVTGQGQYDDVVRRLQTDGIDVEKYGNIIVRPYLHNAVDAIAAADLAVVRAGAMTISELTARGVPAVIIPHPYSPNNHQEHNGRMVERRGGAVVILDRDLNGPVLTRTVLGLLEDPGKLEAMSRGSRSLGLPDAAERIVEGILALARRKK